MALKQISVSLPSVRISLKEAFSNLVSSIPTEKIKKYLLRASKMLTKSIVNYSKKVLAILIYATLAVLNYSIYLLSSFKNLLGRKSSGEYLNHTTTGKRRLRLPPKKIFKPLLLVIITLFIIYGLSKLVSGLGNVSSSNKIQIEGAKAVQEINKEYSFPLRDGNDEEVSSIKYFIQNAELRDEIVVKGQRATAVAGRTFLILTLRITNEYDQSIEIDTRDYLRLSVNKNENEWLAPDIHNDPVEVQAISTKLTRVGFPIDETDRNLVLRVGEINGDKEKIELNLK